MARTSTTPVSDLSTAPFDINEPLVVRDVTLRGDRATQIFDSFADHAALADVSRVHCGSAPPIVILSDRMWNRILLGARAAKANGSAAEQVRRAKREKTTRNQERKRDIRQPLEL
jgi:hypothetical protein